MLVALWWTMYIILFINYNIPILIINLLLYSHVARKLLRIVLAASVQRLQTEEQNV
jgi:hypothetical protein